MAFRIEKAGSCVVLIGLLAAWPARAEQARHDHWRKYCSGNLEITADGISYEGKKEHRWRWKYDDIQQLQISGRKLRVLTYRDSRWKLGADVELEFETNADFLLRVYRLLREKLDQRLVAAIAEEDFQPQWEIPVKHLTRLGGSQGLLKFGADRIAFATDKPGQSRTWRLADIENITSSGPFQMTLTTYERARSHYGNLKGFNFQLKRPLEPARYEELWRRLNRGKGLPVLDSIGSPATGQ